MNRPVTDAVPPAGSKRTIPSLTSSPRSPPIRYTAPPETDDAPPERGSGSAPARGTVPFGTPSRTAAAGLPPLRPPSATTRAPRAVTPDDSSGTASEPTRRACSGPQTGTGGGGGGVGRVCTGAVAVVAGVEVTAGAVVAAVAVVTTGVVVCASPSRRRRTARKPPSARTPTRATTPSTLRTSEPTPSAGTITGSTGGASG